jgi:hypothetical protein
LETEVTVPFPRRPNKPALLTVRGNVCKVKVTVTDLAEFMVTVQVVPETESHPAHAV